ncbi:hypothetical protein LLG96_06945 [bacterium]|nr:hypothetical protein [bacterium]
MAGHSSRRSFLSKSAVAGAAALAAGTRAEAAPAMPQRKLKVGAFGAVAYSFWGLWADLLSPEGKVGTSLFNMELSHVWDKDFAEAQKFASQWGCEAVKKYDDMIGKVDGVVCGGLYEVPWQHKLFRPYLKAGMPCYLSRPWSYRIRDMEEMLDLAAKNNAPLIATATYEHYNEAESLRDKLKGVGQIKSVAATCTGGDFPHFHIQHMMPKILGYDVKQVSLMTNDVKKPQYLQETLLFGGNDAQPQYLCTMHSAPGPYVFHITIIGTEGTEVASMPGSTNYFYRFGTQLIDIQKTLEGKTYQDFDIVRKKHLNWITAHYSHVERKGAFVEIGTVPADWSPPLWMPGWLDDSLFKD